MKRRSQNSAAMQFRAKKHYCCSFEKFEPVTRFCSRSWPPRRDGAVFTLGGLNVSWSGVCRDRDYSNWCFENVLLSILAEIDDKLHQKAIAVEDLLVNLIILDPWACAPTTAAILCCAHLMLSTMRFPYFYINSAEQCQGLEHNICMIYDSAMYSVASF